MDIEKWFREGTKTKIKELRYLTPPSLPYNLFVDEKKYRGADLQNNIVEHNLTIEHYSETIDNENEKVIEDFLNAELKQYEKNREWLNEEKMFVTIYELEPFIEKIKEENNNVKKK